LKQEVKTIFIGDTLKKLRQSKNLSQEEIAGRTGLDRTYISMLERKVKQPTLTTIFLLAEALEIKPSELIQEIEVEYDGYIIKRDTN
jgi:transcriptional regulator with XRE-family HTH domain